MRETIPLEYEIEYPTQSFQSWNAFNSLINREYADNLGKNLINTTINEKNKAECTMPMEINNTVQNHDSGTAEPTKKRRFSKSMQEKPVAIFWIKSSKNARHTL